MYDVNVGIPYIYQIMLSDIKYIYIYYVTGEWNKIQLYKIQLLSKKSMMEWSCRFNIHKINLCHKDHLIMSGLEKWLNGIDMQFSMFSHLLANWMAENHTMSIITPLNIF